MTVDSAQLERLTAGASMNGSAQTPEAMRARLADLLELGQIGATVRAVEVFGRGPSASVDVQLSGDMKLTFERFGDISKAQVLAAVLMSSIGVARTSKAATEAVEVGVLIYRLARHHDAETADASAREWGSEFLRLAALQELDLDDQKQRWDAFFSLRTLNPARDAGEDRSSHSLACASVVLSDRPTGVRLVRCGWFLSYVRREVGGMYSPAALGTQMERVGWQRSGHEGRIKATCPCPAGPQQTLNWRFYTVPKGWQDE